MQLQCKPVKNAYLFEFNLETFGRVYKTNATCSFKFLHTFFFLGPKNCLQLLQHIKESFLDLGIILLYLNDFHLKVNDLFAALNSIHVS